MDHKNNKNNHQNAYEYKNDLEMFQKLKKLNPSIYEFFKINNKFLEAKSDLSLDSIDSQNVFKDIHNFTFDVYENIRNFTNHSGFVDEEEIFMILVII